MGGMFGGGGGGGSVVETHGLPEYGSIPTQIESYLSTANVLSQTAFKVYSTDTAFRTSWNTVVSNNPSTHGHLELPSGNPTFPQDQNASSSPYNSAVNELTAIQKIYDRGTNGDTTVSKGKTLATDDIAGSNHGSNTRLDDWFSKEAEEKVQVFDESLISALDQEAVLLGRYGGGSHSFKQYEKADVVQKAIAKDGTTIYHDDYKRERIIVHNSAKATLHYANETLRDAEMQRRSGLFIREYEQGKIDDAFKLWQEGQENEIKKLDILGNALRSITGSTREKIEPFYRPSVFSQVAGFALTTMPIWSTMTQNANVRKSFEEGGSNFIGPMRTPSSHSLEQSALGFSNAGMPVSTK